MNTLILEKLISTAINAVRAQAEAEMGAIDTAIITATGNGETDEIIASLTRERNEWRDALGDVLEALQRIND